MSGLAQKKWMMVSIIMAIVLLVLTVNSMTLYKQIDKLNEENVKNLKAEWYQLYRLSEIIDKSYINRDFQNTIRYQMLVNQVSHHFTGRTDDLSLSMRNLLVLAYDPLFADLYHEEGTLNKESATSILKDMNTDLLLISKDIIALLDDNDGDSMLDSTSAEYSKVYTQVKAAYEKYLKLVDDYFKGN